METRGKRIVCDVGDNEPPLSDDEDEDDGDTACSASRPCLCARAFFVALLALRSVA